MQCESGFRNGLQNRHTWVGLFSSLLSGLVGGIKLCLGLRPGDAFLQTADQTEKAVRVGSLRDSLESSG